jgi:hypothetical protein
VLSSTPASPDAVWGGGSRRRPARGEQSTRGGRVGSGFPTARSQPPRWIQYLRGPRSVGSGPTLGMPSGLSANSVSRPYWRQTRYHTHSLGDATPALWEADGRRARVQQTGETIPLRSLGKIFNRCFSTPPLIETHTPIDYVAQGSYFDLILMFEDSYLPYLYLGDAPVGLYLYLRYQDPPCTLKYRTPRCSWSHLYLYLS